MLFQAIKSEIVSHISYVLVSKNEAAIIDPRRDIDVYLEIAAKSNAKIKYVFETHRNEDYVIGSQEISNITNATIFHGPGLPWKYGKVIDDNQELSMGLLKIRALHTPGHSPDSMSYVVHDSEAQGQAVIVFTGDTLFVGDVGRTDFLGPKMTPVMSEKMYESINSQLLPLGDGVIVCPAHGSGSVCGGKIRTREISTIGVEKKTNPMLQLSKKEFVKQKVAEKHQTPPYFKQMEIYNLNGPPILGNIPNPHPMTASEFSEHVENCYIIDTRSPISFGGAHIKASYNLPPSRLSNAGWVIDYKKPILLVIEDSQALKFAVHNLFRLGYDKIQGYLIGGIEEWAKQGLSISKVNLIGPHELRSMMQSNKNLVILDVRREGEWNEGHIEGAKHIYLGHLENRVNELPRNVPIAVVCKTGNRSSFGTSILLKAGFKDVYNFLGGIDAWIKSDYPLVK
jgi:hydroxyacylglutathione hydrolase